MNQQSTTRSLARTVLIGVLLFPAACTGPGEKASASRAQHAQCLVCKSEGDLACVDVTVENDTPRTVYLGRTYYFCSEQCCKDFEKDPTRYLPR
jgi:YHS domain-containing protein